MSSSIHTDGLSIQDPRLRWRDLASGNDGPEAAWLAWLADPGSLTARLKSLSEGRFSVEVLTEQWLHIDDSGLRGLFAPLNESHRFWSRQVLLLGKRQPWVAAHTLIPEHSLLGELQEIVQLSARPLGEYLFSHPDLIRTTPEITALPEQGWGRRSMFYLHRKPMMVAEFFLPALLAAAGGPRPK